MAKFVFAYRGGAGMEATPEEQATAMQAWGMWFGQVGAALVDGGNAFGARTAVSSNGSADAASGLGGYSIVTADSLAAATALTAGCPVLAVGGTVDVYECIEM